MSAAVETFRISSVSQYESPAAPAPRVAVFGSVHGNEPCGLRAIEQLQSKLRSGQLQVRTGTLYLVHGNPLATEQRERHTRGGVDLNRLFDYRFEDELASTHWVYEHHRAHELRPLLESLDAVLDLHSTTAPSPAFALASPLPASRAFADALGLPYVTQGWQRPGLLGDRVVTAPLTKRGLPGVGVECGQHDDPAAIAVAYGCMRRALQYLGLIDLRSPEPVAPATALTLQVAIKRPTAGFKFAKPLASMQLLEAGDVIGRDEDMVLCAQRRCHVIMPNDTVSVGEDMIYLAQAE